MVSTTLLNTDFYAKDNKQKLEYYPWTYTAKVGNTGFGVDVSKPVTKTVKARVGFTYLPSWELKENRAGLDYDVDMKFFNFSALVDWHPFDSQFRISSGILYSRSEYKFDPELKSSFNIGGHTYSIDQVGTINSNIDFRDFSPYIGIGWDTTFGQRKNFGFTFDIGLIYQGDPDVRFSSNGLAADDPTFQADLLTESRELERDLDDYKLYPIINIGISYIY